MVTRANILRTFKIFVAFAILSVVMGLAVATLLGARPDLPGVIAALSIAGSIFLLLGFIFIWFLEAFFCFRCLSNAYGMLKYAKWRWFWNPLILYNPKYYAPEGAKYTRLVLDGMLGATLTALLVLVVILVLKMFGADF